MTVRVGADILRMMFTRSDNLYRTDIRLDVESERTFDNTSEQKRSVRH